MLRCCSALLHLPFTFSCVFLFEATIQVFLVDFVLQSEMPRAEPDGVDVFPTINVIVFMLLSLNRAPRVLVRIRVLER